MLLAFFVLCAAVGSLLPFRGDMSAATPAVVLMVPVVIAALVGGRATALSFALIASAVYDAVFVPPRGTLRIELAKDGVATALFAIVAIGTGAIVAHEGALKRAANQRADDLAEMHARLQALVAERDLLEQETRRVAVLEEVDRQRSALLRAVSHDLRTPLGTLRAIASDLHAGTEFDPATEAGLIELLVSESERLDRIVTNLLSLSRIEGGALEPDLGPVEVIDIVHAATHRLRGIFKDVTLVVDVQPDLSPVLADFTQVDLVLTNLLENAARHAPRGSAVTVRATDDGDVVTIEVVDEGPGVDKELVDQLFEPFRSGSGGSGIGLSICRAIVTAHGGTIRLAGQEQPGGHFVVSLPIAR